GTITTHALSIGGNLANNGTIDLSQNADTNGVQITFTGASNATWTGNGNTDLRTTTGVTVNKGTSSASTLDFTPGTGTFTVQGAGVNAVFLIEGGTMNVAGRLTSANPVSYTQSAGTVNICTAGACATSPSFGFTSVLPTNVLNISGGTINIVNSNTLTTADY